MPELEWAHGVFATTLFTLIAAVIPLAYIKQNGWLAITSRDPAAGMKSPAPGSAAI